MGMTTTYTPQKADEICARIAEGEPLRQICRDEHMPGWVTVYRWMEADEGFAKRIAQARKLGFDAIAEEALEIANTPVEGVETEDDGVRQRVKRGDMLGHRKLQVETRLKLLAKWSPAKYGDRASLELTGAEGGPVQVTEADRATRLASLVALAQARQAGGSRDDGSDLV